MNFASAFTPAWRIRTQPAVVAMAVYERKRKHLLLEIETFTFFVLFMVTFVKLFCLNYPFSIKLVLYTNVKICLLNVLSSMRTG